MKYCQNCGDKLRTQVTAETNIFGTESTLYNSCVSCGSIFKS